MSMECSAKAQAIINLMKQRGYQVYFMSMDNMVVCTAHHPSLSRAATATSDQGDDYGTVRAVADKLGIDVPDYSVT